MNINDFVTETIGDTENRKKIPIAIFVSFSENFFVVMSVVMFTYIY